MELRDTVLKDLNDLGLSVYEAKTYLALLERNSLDTAEVSKISGVPRGRIYDVLDTLVKKGIASFKPGKLKKYSAIDIDSLKENLIINGKIEWGKKEDNINRISLNLKKNLSSLYPKEKRTTDPLDYIEVLKNPLQIHNKFLKLISKTQKEILGFSKPPYAAETKAQRREELRVQVEAIKRGVVVKAIIQMPPENNALDYFVKVQRGIEDIKENINYPDTKSFDEFPMKAKIVDELPIKLFVFDEKACFFTLEDPIENETSLTMLVAEHKAMAKSFRFLFESFWDKARDYYIVNNQKYYLYDFKR